MSESSFHLEVMKLLLQVAFADFEMQPEEAAVIKELAQQYRLDATELAQLDSYIFQVEPLPVPDFARLRNRRADVMLAVQTLMLSDLQFRKEEREMMEQIEDMLL